MNPTSPGVGGNHKVDQTVNFACRSTDLGSTTSGVTFPLTLTEWQVVLIEFNNVLIFVHVSYCPRFVPSTF